MIIGIISDVHNNGERETEIISKSLDNIYKKNVDAILIGGDIADYHNDRKIFFDLLKEKSVFYGMFDVMCMLGNHDVRSGALPDYSLDPDLKALYQSYQDFFSLEYSKDFMSFSLSIDDYVFICLNTDYGLKDKMDLNTDAIEWLKQKLQSITLKSKPIFILTHQPLNFTHWRSSLFGGFGDKDKEIRNILLDYPQVVLLCGHIHNGLGTIEFIQRSFGTLIEIPSLTKSENGVTDEGTGWLLKINDEELSFEAWDFFKDIHLHQYDITLKLPTLSFLFNKAKDLNLNINFNVVNQVNKLLNKTYLNDIPDGNNTYRDQSFYGLDKIYDDDTWKEIDSTREILKDLISQEKNFYILKFENSKNIDEKLLLQALETNNNVHIILSDGNWSPQITIPQNGKSNCVIKITSSAYYSTVIFNALDTITLNYGEEIIFKSNFSWVSSLS